MNLNKNIIIALSKYKTDAQIKGESFKVRAYDKVIKNIENINENIRDYIHKVFKDLSNMNLATFTDMTLDRINSKLSIQE